MKISLSTPIYNGLNLKEIISRLPGNMVKIHKKQYIENCLFVYKNENKGFNLDYCKLTRDANFRLINSYL